MAAAPEDRYPSAVDLARDVERWLADEPVSAWREPLAVRARRWAARHRTVVTAAAASVLVAAAVLAVAGVRLDRALQYEREARQLAEARKDRIRDGFRETVGFALFDPRFGGGADDPARQALLGFLVTQYEAAAGADEDTRLADDLAFTRFMRAHAGNAPLTDPAARAEFRAALDALAARPGDDRMAVWAAVGRASYGGRLLAAGDPAAARPELVAAHAALDRLAGPGRPEVTLMLAACALDLCRAWEALGEADPGPPRGWVDGAAAALDRHPGGPPPALADVWAVARLRLRFNRAALLPAAEQAVPLREAAAEAAALRRTIRGPAAAEAATLEARCRWLVAVREPDRAARLAELERAADALAPRPAGAGDEYLEELARVQAYYLFAAADWLGAADRTDPRTAARLREVAGRAVRMLDDRDPAARREPYLRLLLPGRTEDVLRDGWAGLARPR